MRAFLVSFRLHGSDRGGIMGPGWLARPAVAEMVLRRLEEGERQRLYRLHACVVMPNHVHLLMAPRIEIGVLVGSFKSATAREANRMLGRTGNPFWGRKTDQRVIRNATEFERMRAYVEWNPVKAGLVKAPELYPWSSARPALRAAAAG